MSANDVWGLLLTAAVLGWLVHGLLRARRSRVDDGADSVSVRQAIGDEEASPEDAAPVREEEREYLAALQASRLRQRWLGDYWLTNPEYLAEMSVADLSGFTERLRRLKGDPLEYGAPGYELESEARSAALAQRGVAGDRRGDVARFLDTLDEVKVMVDRRGPEETLAWLIVERLLREVGEYPGATQQAATRRLQEMGEPRAVGPLLEALHEQRTLANNDARARVAALVDILRRSATEVAAEPLSRAASLVGIVQQKTQENRFDPGHGVDYMETPIDCTEVNRLASAELARRARDV